MGDAVLNMLYVLVGCAGTAIGYEVGARQPSTTCGCSHKLAMHDPEDGQCYDTAQRAGLEPWPCPCRQYTGKRPATTGGER